MEEIRIDTTQPEQNQIPNQVVEETPPKKTFFQKIAFILLDNERKTEVASEIIEDSNFGKLYRLQLILSVIICSLGLLINSVPVIIGAMLIAPILKPIKIIAFATSTGNGSLYNKGLKISGLTIIVTIAIAWAITKMTPVATLTPEIFARISPTIIDLFIALVGGIIAFLSLGFKKLWEGVAGVAMATALIPPLCITGVGISFLSMEITKGSFLLFLTNFVTIVFVGIVIFYAFGFFATNKKGKKHSIESIFLTIITIILILTPLTQSMRNIADDIKTKQTIENVSNEFLANINKGIEIEKISYQIQDNDTLRISTTIAVPSATPITEKHKNELSQMLALATQKSVNLDINIVNVSSVLIEKKEEITKDQQLQRKIEEYIKTYTGITIIESKIAYNPAPLVYINLFSERENIKGKIENNTELLSKEILGTGTKTLILRQQINGDQEQKEKIAYYQEIETYIKEKLPTNIYIESITIEKKVNEEDEFFLVNIKIKSSLGAKEIQNTLKNIQQKLEGTYPNQFKIQASVVPLNEIYLP